MYCYKSTATREHPLDAALSLAIGANQTEHVKLLIANGATFQQNGSTSFEQAIKAENLGALTPVVVIISVRLTSGNFTPLHKAAASKHEDALAMLNVLLSANARVNHVTDSKQTALHLAALAGRSDMVKRLIECGAPLDLIDRSGSSALSLAACAGHVDCVRVLCTAGALLNIPNRTGLSPLHLAVVGRQVNATKVLLKFNALVNNPSAAKESRTPLLEFLATCKLHRTETSKGKTVSLSTRLKTNREIEILDSLRYANASFDAKDAEGNSALHLCVRYGTEELLDYMINHGVNTMHVNHIAHSALSLACSRDETSMVIKLIQLCPELLQHPTNRQTSASSPFVNLHRNQNFRCLRYLFEAGYRPNQSELEHLSPNSNRKCAAIAKYVENEMGQPQCLTRLSRVAFRNQFSRDFRHSVYQMVLPTQLRSDLLLESPYLFYS
ncbi:hypothetical protein CAPTEDRAFT_223204 [Capitella teleta]|uniref:Uncharacterized protein n=1 Tax=Capitella teleta TaxID=283909 RepID=R7U6B3_CAPTE|nr:hypothetical protein CAPTEDRAFT_223204 [Capitella teleta]|eukprot:ELU01656.1 hypothetical protein CAPTEDRAFT_223204 [Capitella teleta]